LHPKSWTGEYTLLVELTRLGHDIVVLEERRGKKREFSDHYLKLGDRIQTLWYDPAKGWLRLLTWLADRVFRDAFEGRNLVHRMLVIAEAENLFKPDVTVASDGFSYAIPAGIGKRLGLIKTRLVVSYIGADILDNEEASVGHRRNALVNFLLRASFKGINVLRPLSPKLQAILLKDGADRKQVQLLPIHLVSDRDALEKIRFRKKEYRKQLLAALKLPDDTELVVTLSGNQRGKGLHVLAKAWPKILRLRPKAFWILCGPNDPWLATGVWPLLRSLGEDHRVIATGRLEGVKVFEYLAAADLHVNPTLCEGLNMVTVEAAAVDTPTVGGDGAGISDWIKSHQVGLVVPSGDSEALANAIILALENTNLRSQWTKSLATFADEFALEKISLSFLRLLQLPTH
jgi:glycosyltransferase involved in cell wall biosynthesis